MYMLLTMPAIAPGNQYVLMSEVDMSAALHATDRPAKQQLSPKDAMQEPTNVFDKEQSYHYTMIQSYHETKEPPLATVLSQISPVSTPHESSLRHDERAHNHKLHRHKPFKTNSGSQHWQTMTMCCIFPVSLKRFFKVLNVTWQRLT